MNHNTSNREAQFKGLKTWLKKPWVIGLISFVAVVMLIFTAAFISRVDYYRQFIAEQEALADIDLTKDLRSQPAASVSTENNFSIGAEQPKLTIVKFSDFTCPYCQEMSIKLREVLKRHPNQVRLIYKDYPVVNEEGLDFALAARCAGGQNRVFFWLMHDELFNLQGLLNLEDLVELAEPMGLNKSEFAACLDNQEYLEDIKKDAQEAEDLGVIATPTIFLNGHMVPGNIPQDVLLKAVQEFLEN